jgi:DMSO reductase family type II enzyme chaperone
MFVYSLEGLEIEGDVAADVEIEESETTARSGVYQLLGRLIAVPDADSHVAAVAGEWPGNLSAAGELLSYPFDFGAAAILESVSAEDFRAEYARLFEVNGGAGGERVPLCGGAYGGGGREKTLEAVAGQYKYFGLRSSAEDPRPADHLSTELEFMQYLAFRDAASPSPRLQGSYRRAQQDFLESHLTAWLPEFASRTEALSPSPFWKWAASTVSAFVAADADYMREARD